jgi:hypothetical protein
MDVQQAQAIRSFAQTVRADAEVRGIAAEPSSDLGVWLGWADALADQLEQSAVQTLAEPRRPPAAKPSYGYNQAEQTESLLRAQVDLWQRRAIYGRR